MGFNSAETGFSNYTSFVFGGKERGAHFSHNYFWSLDMVSLEYYESECFPVIMKSLMIFINLYFFFIRFNALPQCIFNLVKTFTIHNSPRSFGNLTADNQRQILALTSISYYCACNFVPGGHVQFIQWYYVLVPLIIFFTDLPVILIYQAFKFFYSDTHSDSMTNPSLHLRFALFLTGYFMIFFKFSSPFGIRDLFHFKFTQAKLKQ
jgi:hypothetical protein